MDVPAGVAHTLGHQQVVAVGLGLGRGVDARQATTYQVEVAFVLELDLGDAVTADSGCPHVVLARPSLAPQAEDDRFEQGALPGAVDPVDADQAGGQSQVEGILVDPEVAQVDAGEQHP